MAVVDALADLSVEKLSGRLVERPLKAGTSLFGVLTAKADAGAAVAGPRYRLVAGRPPVAGVVSKTQT